MGLNKREPGGGRMGEATQSVRGNYKKILQGDTSDGFGRNAPTSL